MKQACVYGMALVMLLCGRAVWGDATTLPSSRPSTQPAFAMTLLDIPCGAGAIRVPDGSKTFPGGAAEFSIPGPIAQFKGPDGIWRGWGYLDTYPHVISVTASTKDVGDNHIVSIDYSFEGDAKYAVRMIVETKTGRVLIDEESTVGMRSWYVIDFTPDFAANTLGLTRRDGVSVYRHLPCMLDRLQMRLGNEPDPQVPAAGFSIFNSDDAATDLFSIWSRKSDQWKNAAAMGFAVWEHRQLPGDPESRVSLGENFKADGTPNPRVADFTGKSVYKGHVCVEADLGAGSRHWGFLIGAKPAEKSHLSDALAHQIGSKDE